MEKVHHKSKKSPKEGLLWDLRSPKVFIIDKYLLSTAYEMAACWKQKNKLFGRDFSINNENLSNCNMYKTY